MITPWEAYLESELWHDDYLAWAHSQAEDFQMVEQYFQQQAGVDWRHARDEERLDRASCND